jgi:lysozyme
VAISTSRLRDSRTGKATVLGAAVVALVAGFEGYRSSSYLDVLGIPTICFGETAGVRLGQTKTRAECEGMLIARLIGFERDMRACVKNPDALPAGPYQAFLSFTYNLGAGTFCRSSVSKSWNAGSLPAACDAILAYNKGGRPLRVIPGLTKRRQQERALCLAA